MGTKTTTFLSVTFASAILASFTRKVICLECDSAAAKPPASQVQELLHEEEEADIWSRLLAQDAVAAGYEKESR